MSASRIPSAAHNWAELEAKYKKDIIDLTESTEMAAIEKEIAEEKLDNCERELNEIKDKLAEALLKIEMLQGEQQANQSAGFYNSDSAVTVFQLQKVEEQNELLKQALVKLRDISAKDKSALENLQVEYEELQGKSLDLEEREQQYLEKIKIYEEQIDVGQSAQEMVEKLTQQKTDLEDKMKEMLEDIDCMNKLRDLDEQLLKTARETEIDLTSENDKLRVQILEQSKRTRDLEDYLSDQERTVAKLKEDNRILNENISRLKDQFKESEFIEQQKHQIENAAYKLNFSESKMVEKEAEILKFKRNLAEMEEQMNSLSMITKEQAAQIDQLKSMQDLKISENLELQRALKKKMEEVSELEIRRDMAEKKLQAIQADTESKLSNMTRTIETMKGIEVQHEEDIRRLMEDNELIEKERRELRDQLNRSNRSVERSMQAGNLSMSMVTAPDTSLASLGISFQNAPTSVQASSPAPLRNVSSASGVDDSVFLGKIKDLSAAFEQVNKKNYELELDLALRELDNRIPPYNGSSLQDYYDVERAKFLRGDIQKLKREVRLAMINQKICPKSRNVISQKRSENFSNSKLSTKYQILENQVNTLLSSSSLSRMRSSNQSLPFFQSTPVK